MIKYLQQDLLFYLFIYKVMVGKEKENQPKKKRN